MRRLAVANGEERELGNVETGMVETGTSGEYIRFSGDSTGFSSLGAVKLAGWNMVEDGSPRTG